MLLLMKIVYSVVEIVYQSVHGYYFLLFLLQIGYHAILYFFYSLKYRIIMGLLVGTV